MIDTHCHIDDPQYAEDLEVFLRAQREGGVSHILVPGVNADSVKSVWNICRRHPEYLFPAVGLHPEDVKEDWQKQLEVIHDALQEDDLGCDEDNDGTNLSYIAVGEIGLDYHFDTTYKEEQKSAFRQQLLWAMERDLPVMIHSRDATEDCIAVMREVNSSELARRTNRQVRGVMHCYSGSAETAQLLLEMGLYLGIGGVLTFKNCRLAEHLSAVPLSRIVLETDAPYMAPVPYRGQRNESRWMVEVMRKLSEVYGCSLEQIDETTTANARRLFRLP